MSKFSDAPHLEVADRATFRSWLEANHATATGVWLVMNRQEARRTLYEITVEEALCFGWIDSTAGRVDDERGKLYFAPRKASSGWATTNKARIERLMAEGRMAPAGLAAIERAKVNGSWELLDSVERGESPEDLVAALDARPSASSNWAAWPPSVRKQALTLIAQARRPETRAQRIEKIVDHAARNVRPF
ncbi:MAG: hypothetical protein QOI92_1545 [Chloroflexota bacterium]|jgi:uncharacterized protein YdeI (YjbR/CyaY-like superfamily)|nr:hypothetical protein [Chloroflexota bacterium]